MQLNKPRVNCLLVHGWGMNHTIWQPVIEQLPTWIEANAIDLPGHGQRYNENFSGLQALADDLLKCCIEQKKNQQPLLLVAWSMGALPALQLALEYPQWIDGLLLVSANPCFVSNDSWRSAVEANVFDQFSESLKEDFSGTIRRFLSLQVKGSEAGRIILRKLRERVLQQPAPNQHSLDNGLELLKQVDLRKQLSLIEQPVSWALGGQDGLVKAELAQRLSELMPDASVKLYEKAGHAPFLSHTDEFMQQLESAAKAIIIDR